MSTKTSLSRKHHENLIKSQCGHQKKTQRSWYFPWGVHRIPMSNAASEVQCLHHVSHSSGWFKSLYHVVILYLSISFYIYHYICKPSACSSNSILYLHVHSQCYFTILFPLNKKGQHTSTVAKCCPFIGRFSSIDVWKKEKTLISWPNLDPKFFPWCYFVLTHGLISSPAGAWFPRPLHPSERWCFSSSQGFI